MHFGITEKLTTDYVSLYNNAGLISKASEKIAIETADNYRFQQPHCRLTLPTRGTSENIRINRIPSETSLSYIFAGWLQNTHLFCNRVRIGVQGYPRSLILAPIESAYATSY